ncbi:MAG: 16S rRNA (adenine(1518)-N(6)/adenine(1519)-N(6))-dimethyltransferase RsmA [Candidatus Bathyarchaeia archaeon]|jgi:16S rRNA (adenine1518-N6/adenine1519-N6)-dimethyltransferase
MNLEKMKVLLQELDVVPNKVLGQNFLVDASVYPKLITHAKLNAEDTVLDAGAGFGFLTVFLAKNCKHVIAVEKDPQVAKGLRAQLKDVSNVTLINGDVLKTPLPLFNKTVSAPPYYLSSHLVAWLIDRGFECAVLIVQKEFAERLVAPVGSENYGWLSVVAQQTVTAEVLDEVPRWMFFPPPEVDSVILKLTPWETPPFLVKDVALFRRLTKWLFTQRNKKVDNALVPFIRAEFKVDKTEAAKMASTFPLHNRRARELTPSDFGALADALSQ